MISGELEEKLLMPYTRAVVPDTLMGDEYMLTVPELEKTP